MKRDADGTTHRKLFLIDDNLFVKKKKIDVKFSITCS